MAERGSQQVSVTGIDDKRQITLLLCVSRAGQLLPPQVIYADDWNVTHSANHWSNEATMVEFILKIIVPYVENHRTLMGTPNQRALAIFDVFAAHRVKAVMETLEKHNIGIVFVPAACTDKLQPLDLTLNKEYKEEVRACFHGWYSAKVMEMVEEKESEGNDIETIKVDLRTSAVKGVHAQWLMKAHDVMVERTDLIREGFRKAGLL